MSVMNGYDDSITMSEYSSLSRPQSGISDVTKRSGITDITRVSLNSNPTEGMEEIPPLYLNVLNPRARSINLTPRGTEKAELEPVGYFFHYVFCCYIVL